MSSDLPLTEQFASHAHLTPGRAALRIDNATFTYGELWDAASTLAAQLRRKGVGRNDRVCLLLDKSFELYAAIWGTWLAGAAYVPLAPSYPSARLRLILERAKPRLVWFGSEALWGQIGAAVGADAELIDCRTGAAEAGRPAAPPHPDDLAYVLFTSGSTGVPKGVMLTNANVRSFVTWAQSYFAVTPNDVMSGHSDLTFDLSVFDTFVAHCSGACLAPVTDPFDRTSPSEFVKRHAITIWFSVPSVLTAMIALGNIAADKLASLRWMAFCGEPLLPQAARQLMTTVPSLRVANLYGPTEATVACAAYELRQRPAATDDAVPFGWRTGDTEVFVWSDGQQVAVEGESGEVYIAGAQVGPGYLDDPEETERRFVSDPRTGTGRCFRTGDVASVRAEGPVFNMRLDNQVKFRGWRIELGDIERALATLPGIIECAVALIRRDGKPDALAAFVRSAAPTTGKAVLSGLRQALPDYMIPTHVRVLADFPRTLNDKIDRGRLGECL